MKRRLGDSEVFIDEITLGTWGLASNAYGKVDPQEIERLAAHAMERGVFSFDMAPTWGNGASEERVGAATKARRDECVYITRCGRNGVAAENLRADIEGSLKRLDTDHVDVLLLHNIADEELVRDEVIDTMNAIVDEGKARAWGASVVRADDARAVLARGAKAICIQYSLLHPDDLEDIASEVSLARAGVIVRSALIYGLLAGVCDSTRKFSPADHRARRWTKHALRERSRQVDALRPLALKVGSLAELALRYALNSHFVTTVAVGIHKDIHLDVAASCMGQKPYLSEEVIERLPSLLAGVGV